MRERALAAGGLVFVAVCCGGPALIGALLGGVAVAAMVRATALALLGLGATAGVAVLVVRRRRHLHDNPTESTTAGPPAL